MFLMVLYCGDGQTLLAPRRSPLEFLFMLILNRFLKSA